MKLNDKQKEFCRLIAIGTDKGEAYRKAYKQKKLNGTCSTNAGRLLKNAEICTELQRLRNEADSAAVADRREIMEFWTRALRTPYNEINGNSDLCQEISYTKQGDLVLKSVSKADAAKELSRLLGAYEPERVENTVNLVGSVLAGIIPTPIMQGNK